MDTKRPEGQYLTVRDVAEHFGISQKLVRKLITDGRLPALKLSPRITRINSADLDALSGA